MIDIRKLVTIRDVTYSELGHKAAKPIVRAVGMAVIDNPYAGKHHDDLRKLWEAGGWAGDNDPATSQRFTSP
jgi:Amino acid synthesis